MLNQIARTGIVSQCAGFGACTRVLPMQNFATATPSIARWGHTTPLGMEFGVGRGHWY